MNEATYPDNTSNLPWLTSDHRVTNGDPSMSPGNEAPAAAVDLLKKAAQGAHDTIDRVADGAAPAVQQLGKTVSAAGSALRAKTDQLRVTRDEWTEGVRTTVRANPLASVAAALALGAVIARLVR